ncbi:MAG: M48 family metallopeptidase [Terriglobia bacterium]
MDFPPAVALPARRSLAGWAVLALGLVVGFYLLTLLLATVFIYLPYQILSQSGGGLENLPLFLFGLLMAGTLLWSLMPRRDKFKAPGPVLQAARHPRLFAEIELLATALNEPLPQDVYLIPEINAWVAQRGGLMGFGSRRAMGLGLPLLQALTIPQFRAVLAHEFGHYYGGDTRLGPWVYKTRATMVRTLIGLGQPPALLKALTSFVVLGVVYFVVTRVLAAYWNLFLRTTQLVSRRQEYRADELACYVAGSRNLIEGLQGIHWASAAVPVYWVEVGKMINAGYRPPIAEGFAHFMAASGVKKVLGAQLEKELAEPRTTPFDSHPPLRDRLAAAGTMPQGGQDKGDLPAISLIEDVSDLEGQMLGILNPKTHVASLKPAEWGNTGANVYVQMWTSFVEENKELLTGLSVTSLPGVAEYVRSMGSRIRSPKGKLLTPEQRAERAAVLLGSGFSLALLASGWQVHAHPGECYFQRGVEQLRPFHVVQELAEGKLTREAWLERARNLGIEELRLDRA